MLPSMMRQPFDRRRYPTTVDHGTATIDRTVEPTVSTFYGSIQPGTGQQDTVNRNGAEIAYTVFALPDADVKWNDFVQLPDGEYFVNGAPERWSTGILDHLVIRLSRWAG